MSEVETEAVVVDAEAAGQGPVADAGTTVVVDPARTADGAAVGESSPHDESSTENESSSAVDEPAPGTSIDASLTPEFSAPDANPEPPTEFVPASFVPAEFEPSEPSDPSIFTEPEIVSDEDDEDDLDEDTADTDSEPSADEPEQSDQASASEGPADPASTSAGPDEPAVSPVEPVVQEPVTPADAARAELAALGFVVAADAADAAVLAAAAADAVPAEPATVPIPASSAEVTEDVPVVAPTVNGDQPSPGPASDETQPVKPAGPKLTPISQLQTRQPAAQHGRASVAPAPFRAEPDRRTQAPARHPGPPTAAPAPAPQPPAPPAPSHQPHAAGSASVPQAPAQPAAEPSRGTAAVPQPTVTAVARVTPPAGLPAVTAPAESQPTAYVEPETDPRPTTYTEPPTEPSVKLKPALKPMGPAGVSARARVAPLDPNRIPLEPTAEERAAAAQAEAARVAAERAEAQRVANERAEAQRVANERAEAQRVANDRAAAQRAANERAIQERAGQERAAQQRAAAEHAAQVAAFQAAQAETARVEAARVDAAQRGAHQQAMRERAAHEQFARDQAARDQAARDQAARDQAAGDQAARDRAARDQAARDHAARSAAAQAAPAPTVRSTAPKAVPRYVPGSDRHAAPWSPAVADANVPVPEGKKRRAGRLALVAGIVVVALLGGGFVGLKVLRNTPEPDLAKVPVFATPGAVLEVPASAAPMPTIAGMAAAVAKPLHDPRLGTHVSFQVSDLATGKVLFSQNRLSPTTPASTMKLATASALLGVRGPNYRLTTKVVAGRHPGEVVLIGGGDPTLSAGSDNPNYPEAARISDLADQVKRALGSTKPTKVIIDTSLFSGPTTGPGWDQDDAHSSYATPIYSLTTDAGRKDPNEEGDADRFDNTALAAGQIFAKLLGLPITAVTSGRAPAGATELGSVQSAPLLRIIENMLITSDNVVAEFMARQVAIALNQPASFAGGAAAVIGQLTKMGIPMQGVTIVDGSGLSPNDRLTPAMLGSLLQFAASDAHPNMHGLFSGLPVAGWSGTLAGRFTTKGTTGARGVFRAKTGTLTGVHALAGTVVDASGRPLVFVLLLDKVAWNLNYGAAMDRLGAAVAACGCTS